MIRKNIFKFVLFSYCLALDKFTFAQTVNVYLENKTKEAITTTSDKGILIINPAKTEVVCSQERRPLQNDDDSHPKPSTITSEVSVAVFKLKKPITIKVTTSSTEISSMGPLIKRDKLEWTVSHPSEKDAMNPVDDESVTLYQMDTNYPSGHRSSYIVRGLKKGADIPALPAADVYFTTEEAK